ncbi:LETM1 domain-containing protein 1-like isoform X1 [Hypomesus transpacificus]|uniref:LETM1 domain-containing protein 1-like isoform X1 n=1 Tax=Hypomesus transpacificus TaxID=137520 RepID=UPI001F07C1BC|nr:LETM1 domain-containing protein 1-like isoform X1 [Hypomesus transpacificus]
MALCKRGVQCCLTLCNYPFHGFFTSASSTPRLTYSRLSVLSCRHYSLSQGRLGILQKANEKYERFLQHRFPQLYILYNTFVKGFRLLLRDMRETRRIQMKMLSKDIPLRQLPYREMETFIMFRKDMLKAIPLVLISIPPFAIVVVFALMYLFPRQLLIRHLWTPQQQTDFQGLYHDQRCRHHGEILKALAWIIPQVKQWTLRSHLLNLCSKVQSGAHPSVKDINAVRSVFSGHPLGITAMDSGHMRLLCSQLLLTPWLPGFLIRRRLKARALDVFYLDQALVALGQGQLTDEEIHQACYLRGLNPSTLSPSQCREWLLQWLQLSTPLKESETSFLLHNMVLLSVNYPEP